MVANSIVEHKTRDAMLYEGQTMELRMLGILPFYQQTHGGESKEDADKKSGKPTGNCAGFSDKDRSTIEDGMPKGTIAEQLQKMQDKANIISKLQRELWKEIQAFEPSKMMTPTVTCPTLGLETGHRTRLQYPTKLSKNTTEAQNNKLKMQYYGNECHLGLACHTPW